MRNERLNKAEDLGFIIAMSLASIAIGFGIIRIIALLLLSIRN